MTLSEALARFEEIEDFEMFDAKTAAQIFKILVDIVEVNSDSQRT